MYPNLRESTRRLLLAAAMGQVDPDVAAWDVAHGYLDASLAPLVLDLIEKVKRGDLLAAEAAGRIDAEHHRPKGGDEA